MTTLADIYRQAATVRNESGVDPAIVVAIMSTETNVNRLPITLGITTGAPSGKGSSGQSVGTSTPGAVALGQPGAFWGYNDGAEAAIALGNYIRNSGLYGYALGDLNNAQHFFADLTANNSNYYVPMPGGESKAQYYAHWAAIAQQFSNANGNEGGSGDGSVSTVDPSLAAGAAIVSGASSGGEPTPASSSGGGQFTLVPALNGPGFTWPGIKISTGFLWSAGFFILAGLLIIAGLILAFRRQIEATAASAARGMAGAA